ncbi:MAG: hypothetical protein PHE43_04230 [Candidatus Nanoarchaeia archaeon]|nr:hypothetical protein [Candidatus Nanoarchaeia archaeon]
MEKEELFKIRKEIYQKLDYYSSIKDNYLDINDNEKFIEGLEGAILVCNALGFPGKHKLFGLNDSKIWRENYFDDIAHEIKRLSSDGRLDQIKTKEKYEICKEHIKEKVDSFVRGGEMGGVSFKSNLESLAGVLYYLNIFKKNK